MTAFAGRLHNNQFMQTYTHVMEQRWREAVAAGELDVWDLRLPLDTVHHAPAWKRRLGFPDPNGADSTHFWRCRVHPDDLDAMLAAMRAHLRGQASAYEARFRLRSTGSGYRLMQSWGRAVERDAQGHALRMVGSMVDLTGRPCTPQTGLPEGPRGPMAGTPMALPFHELLTAAPAEPQLAAERQRLVAQVADLLQAALDARVGATGR